MLKVDGERSNPLPIFVGSGFGPLGSRRLQTISGDWNLLWVQLQKSATPGSERPLAKRAAFESRFTQKLDRKIDKNNNSVIPSEP